MSVCVCNTRTLWLFQNRICEEEKIWDNIYPIHTQFFLSSAREWGPPSEKFSKRILKMGTNRNNSIRTQSFPLAWVTSHLSHLSRLILFLAIITVIGVMSFQTSFTAFHLLTTLNEIFFCVKWRQMKYFKQWQNLKEIAAPLKPRRVEAWSECWQEGNWGFEMPAGPYACLALLKVPPSSSSSPPPSQTCKN